jgi:hypothetical protein
MSPQVRQLFLDCGREVGFEAALPHDFFGSGLQVDVRRILIGH